MSRQLLILDLKFLETDSHPAARVWRGIRRAGGATKLEIDRMHERAHYGFGVLRRHGWIEESGEYVPWTPPCANRRNLTVWRVRTTQNPASPVAQKKANTKGANNGIATAKRRLTEMAKRAYKARNTGLAHEMGRCLGEIEKECRAIRDSLRGS